MILEQKRRTEAFLATRGGPAPQKMRPFAAAPGFYPQMQAPQMMPPGMGALPTTNFSPQVEELRRELATVLGADRAAERFGALLAQMPQAAPPPVIAPPPPAAPVLSPQEQEWIEEGRFRAMAAKYGFVPAGQNQPPPPPAPQPPPQAVVAAGVTEPITGLETLLKGFEAFEKMRPRFAKLAGVTLPEEGDVEPEEAAPTAPADDPNPMGLQPVPMTQFLGSPVMFPTKAEGWVETFQSFIMANPAIAMEGLNRLSGILTSQAFTRLIEKFTGGGGAPAKAAQQALASGMVGRGTAELTNGAAAHAVAPLMQGPPPAAPAAPPRFRGPTG